MSAADGVVIPGEMGRLMGLGVTDNQPESGGPVPPSNGVPGYPVLRKGIIAMCSFPGRAPHFVQVAWSMKD